MGIEKTLDRVLDALKSVRGLDAMVLGGSRAKGNATPSSDIDLGLYYRDGALLDVAGLGRVAAELDDAHRSGLINGIGEWGPWINGGGWLTVDGIPVDFLLRDTARVSAVIEDCAAGRVAVHYQCGHPYGFVNAIYCGEVFYCRPLQDPEDIIGRMKARLVPYPPLMKKAIMDQYLWEAGFTMSFAHKGVARQDVAYLSGCLFRAYACLMQALYALNGTYLMNEKGMLDQIDGFALVPADLKKRIGEVFTGISADPVAMEERIHRFTALVRETEALWEKEKLI